MKNLVILFLSSVTLFAQAGAGRVTYSSGGGTTYAAGTGISISGNTISATGTNVAIVVYDTTQFTTNASGALEIINGALMTNIVVTALTNSSLTASALAGTDTTKKMISISLGTGLNLTAGTLAVTTIPATVGSMINTGASIDTALPRYNGITGTNMVPSKLTVTGETNLNVGALTVTNLATFGTIVVTNGVIFQDGVTNSALTASQLMATDSTKKYVSVAVGDGLTNSAGTTLKVALAAGSNVTFTTNNGQITIASSGGGGSSDNWVASGTTNSTLAGTGSLYNLVVTNTATFGNGTTVPLITYALGGNITNASTGVVLTNDIQYLFNSNVTVNATLTATTLQQGGVGVVTTARTVSTGAGTSGGGDLSANRTIIWAPDTFVNNITLWDAANATRTLTIGLSGATDPVWTYGNNSADLTTGVLKYAGNTVGTSANNLSFFSATTSAQLLGIISDESGSGVLIGGTSPTITTPTISGAIAFPDGVRQTFNPDATIPGLNVGAQAGNPSSLSNGDIWYDSTGQALNARINGATVALGSGGTTVNSTGGPLFVSTADAAVANTTTETSIFGSGTGTKTLPANYITAGKNFRVLVRGRMGTKAVAPGNLTIKFKLGSTVLWSAVIAPAISLANDYFEFVGDFTGRTTGASGTVFAQAIAAYNDGTTTTVNAPIAANTGTSTIDTTATQVVDVTATWATADANNTITGSIGVIMDGTGGTVTSTAGSLTSNAVVLGAGGTDTKVSSSITTDGTAKVTLGTIDVGNTTDTTISRPSAGDISVEGNIVYRAGGTDVPVTDGGTGISVGTSGGITYFSGTTTMASSAALAANAIVIGGGAGATPATTTTGTGVLTAIGNTANATGGIVTVDGTATLVNKTLAMANNDITGFPVTIGIACSDETTAITTGTGKATFRVPFAFTLTEVRATVTTAPTGSTIIIDINENGTTVMTTTKLSIDATEKTSTTAASAAAITDSAIADDSEITIDFDQVGSTVSGAGVKIWLIGTRTI